MAARQSFSPSRDRARLNRIKQIVQENKQLGPTALADRCGIKLSLAAKYRREAGWTGGDLFGDLEDVCAELDRLLDRRLAWLASKRRHRRDVIEGKTKMLEHVPGLITWQRSDRGVLV